MSPRRVLGLLSRVLTWVVLLVSGLYVLVYLWRWEWDRALIAGIFFLGALVVVSTLAVLDAVRRLSTRLDRVEQRERAAAARAARTVRRANDERAGRHFDWLREPPDRLGVFVPVLLGTGALLSGLAYLIERAAGAVASTTVDRRTAGLLAPDLPLGPEPVPPPDTSREGARRRTAVAAAATAVGTLGAIGVIVVVLMVFTQSRPDPEDVPRSTTIELQLRQRHSDRPIDEVATALWIGCRGRVSREVAMRSTTVDPPDRAVLVLDGPIGPLDRRRLVGCLQDAELDRWLATVRSVRP